MPTGTKMLAILGLALLPLLVVAILSSYNSARTRQASGATEANAMLALSAQRLTSAITRIGVVVRAASAAAARLSPEDARVGCEGVTAQLRDNQLPPIGLALYAGGNRLACTTPGFAVQPLPLLAAGTTSEVRVDPQRQVLRLLLMSGDGQALGQVEIPQASLLAIAAPSPTRGPIDVELAGDAGSIQLFSSFEGSTSAREIVLREPVAGERLSLTLRATGGRMTVLQSLLILLPVLLWLLAAIIVWAVVRRWLLRPLVAMQRAVAAYQPGTTDFQLPPGRSPSREIADLGAAFADVTRTVSRHEAEAEAAVERQTRLVREVHHRVKNNLQVVASLLNIHSRGAESEDVAAAYASIQRRVDALAVVHRNHYAELEDNRGVALKALISELGANLRASAPAAASAMQVRLSIEPLYATQDVAVSTAFLVTEVVEFGMLCGARTVSITLEPEQDGRARLTLESESLTETASCSATVQERFDRILTGLSRQLRSTLEKDVENGRYSLTVAVIGRQDLTP